MSLVWPVALAAGALLGALACGKPEPPVNVLFVSFDSLRADHLHAYGYERETSPSLDRLAAGGVLFENAISETSWTLPSHLTLLTGLTSRVHGVTYDGRRLSEAHTTLAESLREVGYRTEAFVSAPYLHPIFGFDQGFERYEVLGSTIYDEEDFSPRRLANPEWQERASEADIASHQMRSSEVLAELVEEAVARLAGEPFFLFVHMFDPHYDYDPPEAYWRRFNPDYAGDFEGRGYTRNPRVEPGMPSEDLEQIVALYDGEIRYTDEHFGRMLEALERAGLTEQTLVVATSDHGEEFFEHGRKGHRATLFDEQLRVPLILRLPGGLPEGKRLAMQVRAIDVLPTILELLGVAAPAEAMGRSLVPYALGLATPEDLPAVSFLDRPRRLRLTALRTGSTKLLVLRSHERPGKVISRLFDLAADPTERRPERKGALLHQELRALAEFERQEAAARKRLAAPPEPVAQPDAMRKSLEALGYIETPEP